MKYSYPKYFSWILYFFVVTTLSLGGLMLTRATQLYQWFVTISVGLGILITIWLFIRRLNGFSIIFGTSSLSCYTWRKTFELSYDLTRIELKQQFGGQRLELSDGTNKISIDRTIQDFPKFLGDLKRYFPSYQQDLNCEFPLLIRVGTFHSVAGLATIFLVIFGIGYFWEKSAAHFKSTGMFIMIIGLFFALLILLVNEVKKTVINCNFSGKFISIRTVFSNKKYYPTDLKGIEINEYRNSREIILHFADAKYRIPEDSIPYLLESFQEKLRLFYHLS